MGLGLSGLRLGLGQQLWGTVWSPAKLFPTGTEEGLFLDFSDVSTLYTDQTFSTNISAIGDPVGGVIDKSQGGDLGPDELVGIGSWIEIGSGTATGVDTIVTVASSVNNDRTQVAVLTPGRNYYIEVTVSGLSGGNLRLYASYPNTVIGTVSSDRTYVIPLHTATLPNVAVQALADGVSATVTWSVKELPGNHLVQATAAARPIWTRHPKSGVRNIHQFDEVFGSEGTLTLSGDEYTFTENTNSATHRVRITIPATTGANVCQFKIKSAGRKRIALWAFTGAIDVKFDFETGAILEAAHSELGTTTITGPDGGGFYTVTQQYVGGRTLNVWAIDLLPDDATDANYTGDGVSGIIVKEVQVEIGATATDYQTRVSQYDVTESGVDDCYGLTFDGIDDYMVTAANLDMSGTSQITVCSGMQALSEKYLTVQQGTSAVAGFKFGAWNNTTQARFIQYDAVNKTSADNSVSKPGTYVFTGGHTDGGNQYIRTNGVVGDTDTETGTVLANATLSIGDGTPSNFSTGTLYSVTLTDYILDAEQLAALEEWTAARTPEVFLWPRDFLGLTGTHDYYIDATLGNDANDGSEGAPWASLNKIDGSFLSAGATTRILVRAGTYDKATDFIEVVGTALNSEIDIAFEPGCIMDGTATAGAENGFEFTGTVAYVSRIYGNGLVVRDYVDVSAVTSPNGVGNRGDNHLTVHDVYVSNCNDGFSAHADATMILHDCSASACLKGAFLHDNNSITEHYRCLFEIGTASGSNGANASTVSMALEDCVIVGTTGGCGFKMQAGNTAIRCQIGDASQRLDIDAFGATITDSYLNVYTDGNDYHTFRRCYGKFSTRLRTPGGLDMQDCVIVGPATGQSAVVFSSFNSGGAIAMTFSGNVVATSAFQSFDATNAGHLLSGGATFAGNSLWSGAAYDADLDASLISGTITTDPQIGSADSYLMADYASAAGLAGFGSGDVVERPAAIPRELRDTI